MKKTLCLLISLLFCLSCFGCSDNDEKPKTLDISGHYVNEGFNPGDVFEEMTGEKSDASTSFDIIKKDDEYEFYDGESKGNVDFDDDRLTITYDGKKDNYIVCGDYVVLNNFQGYCNIDGELPTIDNTTDCTVKPQTKSHFISYIEFFKNGTVKIKGETPIDKKNFSCEGTYDFKNDEIVCISIASMNLSGQTASGKTVIRYIFIGNDGSFNAPSVFVKK